MRLTVMFVAAVGLSSGALSLGSWLVVSEQRHEALEHRAQQQARVTLGLSRGENSAAQLDRVVSLTRERTGFESVVVADQVVTSSAGLTIDNVPAGVRSPLGDELTTGGTQLGDAPFFVVAGNVPDTNERAQVYLFVSEAELRESLAVFRKALLGGWLVVTALAALVGSAVSRRALHPIHEATNAARALAEGMLDTRLPDTGKDEFGAWARYFNEMASALQFKIDALSAAHERERRFTADVAHDLRTPLAAMMTSASLLEESVGNPRETRRSIELLVADVRRLSSLVVDLLDLARLDSDEQHVELQPVELNALVNDILIAYKWSGSVATSQQSHCIVLSDRRRLERIITNVLSNAMTHGGGVVSLSVDCEDKMVSIEIADEGPGIPEDQLDSIFDRFHKASESRSTTGSGLGLAIAARHAAILGAGISASNRPEGGALFRLNGLPADTEPLDP